MTAPGFDSHAELREESPNPDTHTYPAIPETLAVSPLNVELSAGGGHVDEDDQTSVTRSTGDRNRGRKIDVQIRVKNNRGTIAGVVENVRRILDYHELTPDYVEACEKAFATPDKLGDAERKIRENHVIVIVAEADSGRHDAAVVLLRRSAPRLTLHEVRRENGDRLDIAALDIEERVGWLLDLRSEVHIEHSFGRSLMAERDRLRSRGSFLAVVISPELWSSGGVGAGELEFLLKPAEADAIVTSRLAALEGPIDARLYLQDTRIAHRLEHARPAEAVLWAEAIAEVEEASLQRVWDDAHERMSPEERQKQRVDEVLKVRGNWRSELRDWHIAHPDSRARHFLLAAAVLEGCPAGQIFTAASSSANALGEPPPEDQGLRGPGILELVHHVEASLVEDERVWFDKPDYADAVLDYFWIDRQHLQTKFVDWMSQLPLSLTEEASVNVTDRIANYVLRWTVRHRSLRLLRQVTREWAPHDALRTVLRYLLTAGALHLDIGKSVRDEMLDWAKDDQELMQIRILVADVCAGEFALIHPKAALYRLATLARGANSQLSVAVTEAISALWRHVKLHAQILNHVSNWCAANEPARRAAGASAFLALASLRDSTSGMPEIAVRAKSGTASLRQTLVRGWRAVLSMRPATATTDAALAIWLDAAATEPEQLAQLQDILAQAMRGEDERDVDLRRFVYLTSVLFSWRRESGDEGDVDRGVQVRDAILNYVVRAVPELGLATSESVHDNSADQNV